VETSKKRRQGANAELNILHVSAAFLVQSVIGVIIAQWPATESHAPADRHRADAGLRHGAAG